MDANRIYIPGRVTDITRTIEQRYVELCEQGDTFERSSGSSQIERDQSASARAYLAAAANLIRVISGGKGLHYDEALKVLAHEKLPIFVPYSCVAAMQGILTAAYDDMRYGLLSDVRYQSYAITFDDFLDHAAEFHKGGRIQESAVLASVVLEDVMRRVAEKHGVTETKMDRRIDELVKIDVFTSTYAKRVKSWAGMRNDALHADWEKLDLPTIGATISGIRELIDHYLV